MQEKYRFVPVLGLDAGELTYRLTQFFERLPRLKIDYTAYIEATHRESAYLTMSEFDMLCKSLSLRTEVFAEFERDYFDMTFAENLQIARERGSHDTYG